MSSTGYHIHINNKPLLCTSVTIITVRAFSVGQIHGLSLWGGEMCICTHTKILEGYNEGDKIKWHVENQTLFGK